MTTPNNAPKSPRKDDQNKPAAKPEQETKGGKQQKQDSQKQKQDPKSDANARKDLPTSDHVAAKENAETPPNDETMSDQPGPYMTPSGNRAGRPIDKNTMSNQPGSIRGKE